MTLPVTYSVAEVAEALGQPTRYVREKCRRQEWPHTRGSRGSVRFTAEQYARVLALMSVEPTAAAEPRLALAPRSRRRTA